MRLFARPLSKSTKRPAHSKRLSLEVLEDRVTPTIDLTSGVLTITGTTGADQLMLQLKSGDQTTLQASDNNGSSFQDFALSGVNRVVVNGQGGADTLTLNLANGLIGSSTISGGLPISFVGGTGQDTLKLTGNASGVSLNETYTLGTDQFSGTLALANGSGATAAAISYSLIEGITDTTNAASLTINGTAGRDLFQLTDGTTVNGVTTNVLRSLEGNGKVALIHHTGSSSHPTVTIVVDANAVDAHLAHGDTIAPNQNLGNNNAVGFVTLTFANKAAVNINGQGGNDIFALNVTTPATGLSTIRLDGGTGNDALEARTLPGNGVALTLVNVERVLSDADDIFIEDQFELQFNRDDNDDEHEFFKHVLHGQGRDALTSMLGQTLESLIQTVRTWYQTYLGRPDSNNDAPFWANQMRNGEALEAVLAKFLSTAEFQNFANNLIGGTDTNQNFVNALYQGLLNRTPATDELNFWVNAVQSQGRQAVALAFLETAELRTNMIASFYKNFLHRDADDDGLRFWVRSALDLLKIEQRILSSGEFFNDD